MKRTALQAAARLALLFALLFALAAGIAGCSDDNQTAPDALIPRDGGSEAGNDGAGQCKSFKTEHETLLNAPTNATVLKKTPTHPPVGDGGLP